MKSQPFHAALASIGAPDHPRLGRYLDVLGVLMTREFQPLRHIAVEEINGARALESSYRVALGDRFVVAPDHRTLRLSPRVP